MVPRAHIPAVGTIFLRKIGGFGGLVALGLALGVLVGATSAEAFQREGELDLETVQVCLNLPENRDALAQMLERLRWQEAPPASLSDSARDGLALLALAAANGGAMPGEGWQAGWQAARQAVPSADATLYTSPGGSLLQITYQSGASGVTLTCALAMSSADMAQTLAGLVATFGAPLSDLPVFKTLPGTTATATDATRTFSLTLVDAAELAESIGVQPAFAGLLTTRLTAAPPAE